MRRVVLIEEEASVMIYDVSMSERPYFDKDIISDFITDMVFATSEIGSISKKEYKSAVMSSVLCNFEIKKVHYMSKLYLN